MPTTSLTKPNKITFGDPIVYSSSSPYQRLVVTKWHNDTRLFINGNLQFSSADEARYHEALVLPVMEQLPEVKEVLILGGGDGLAAREVLKYPQVEHITLVDLDPENDQAFSHFQRIKRPEPTIAEQSQSQHLQHRCGQMAGKLAPAI